MGWAVFDGDTLVEHGVLSLKRGRPAECAERIASLVDTWTPDEVAVERVDFAAFTGAHAGHWRIRTLVEFVLDDRGMFSSIVEVNTTKLKRYATGRGNANKAEMCRAARERYGVELYARGEVEDDTLPKAQRSREEDQADAIFVAAWALSRDNIEAA